MWQQLYILNVQHEHSIMDSKIKVRIKVLKFYGADSIQENCLLFFNFNKNNDDTSFFYRNELNGRKTGSALK